MDLDKLTIGELIDKVTLGELRQLFVNYKSGPKLIDGGVRIVILQRGWVAVGRYARKGRQCKLVNGYIIRKWGTTEGLSELAIKGPLANTILDKSPDIEFHQLTEIANIQCDEDMWLNKCPLL